MEKSSTCGRLSCDARETIDLAFYFLKQQLFEALDDQISELRFKMSDEVDDAKVSLFRNILEEDSGQLKPFAKSSENKAAEKPKDNSQQA